MEGLLLTVRFDTASLAQTDGWWTWPLGHVSAVPRFVLAVGTVLLLGGRELSKHLDTASATEPAPERVWRFALAHGAALSMFVWLTTRVLEGPRAEVSQWVPLWLFAGVVTVITVAPIVARPRVLATFARSASSLLAVSFAAGLVAWGAGQASSALSHPLQRLTSKAVFAFVATFRADAFHDADAFVVGTPRFEVEIAPACSGYEGIGLIVVFQVVFLWTHRRVLRFPWSLILIPLGALIAACANVVRLAVLVLVGEQAPAVAQGGFHSYAGALLFSGIALLTAFAALRLRAFSLPEAREQADAGPLRDGAPPADAHLFPFLAFLAVQMLTGLFHAGGVDALYGVRVLAAAFVLWLFRARYTPRWKPIEWSAPAIGLAVGVLWLALTPPSQERNDMLLHTASTTSPALVAAWLVMRALGSVIVVPVIEELAFRGYVLRRLVSRDFDTVDHRTIPLWPILISSLLFGLMHTQQILAGTIAGLAFALAARRHNRLADAFIAHATANATLVVYAVVTSRWSAWL